jgi:mannose-6-phosphate isomerase-like protein (cupin superfamily)
MAMPTHAPENTDEMAVNLNAKEMKWGEAPPDLPKGAKMVVLYGDPSKAGLFTLRGKFPAGYKVPPHWHSNAELLTIISGTVIMHMGDTMTAEPHRLTVGGFHSMPAKMHHALEAKTETVLQVSGEGPFDIHYLNEADNPTSKTARK